MYYVEDGTTRCGFYECTKCHNRFLHARIVPAMMCPDCDKEVDMEVGPDEEVPEVEESAKLLEVIEGEENVLRYDTLLSLAITGGDDSWL